MDFGVSDIVLGQGSKAPKMVIIGDMPNKFNSNSNSVLGDSNLLYEVLYDVIGIKEDDLYFTYVIKRMLPNGKKPTKKQIEEYSYYLSEELRELQPECVLCLGELSMNIVCGTKKLGAFKGKQQPITLFENAGTAFATYSPYYVDNNMEALESWAKDINKAWDFANGTVQSVSATKVVYCDTFEKIVQLAKYVQQTGTASFDFETKKIDDKLGTFEEGFYATTLSISFQVGSAWVIPLQHFESPYTEDEVAEIMGFLKKAIFENPKVRKIGHNLNFDFHVLRTYGIEKLRGRIDDTMLMQHLHDETEKRGLKELTSIYFQEFSGYENELDGMDWTKIPIRTLIQYNGTDTDLTLRLCILLESYLLEDEPSYIIYRNLTMAVFRPLWEAEKMGMLINRDFLSKAVKDVDGYIEQQVKILRDNKIVKRYELAMESKKTEAAISELQNKLVEWRNTHNAGTKTEQTMVQKLADLKSGKVAAYEGVSFGSPKQMQDLLYFSPDGFKFKSLDTGTGKDVLAELESQDKTGFIKELLKLRSMEKMQGTYLKGILQRLDRNDRIHTSFKLAGTASGRISSANPNLQNMPNSYKLDDDMSRDIVKKVKKSFIPPKGHSLIQVDFSQAEIRIIASFAKEENMIAVYAGDGDIHTKTAASVMHLTVEQFKELEKDVQKLKRFQAKAVNFGFLYGMSAEGFQDYAKTGYKVIYTDEEAVHTRNAFFNTYPALLDYHELYKEKGRKYGWVRTLFGRRRRLLDINSSDGYKRGADERVAVNSPIQGSAGEFTLFAIALLYLRLPNRWKIVNTIHDSIMLYVPTEEVKEAAEFVQYTMSNLPTKQYFQKELYKVQMKADAEASTESWADLQEL